MTTPCRYRGCPNLVTSRMMKGFCDEHAEHRNGWLKTQRQKGNTTKRGYGNAWRKLRNQIMERDAYLCQICKANGKITQAQAVDHIINKASGGTDDQSNLQAICHACHKLKTQSESKHA
ncbi:HNH endonuclease [Moraxella boevrei]|uniref:HNH endonuclease n=1 Tax=Faucicola boevrei TaxID=346665 RepID=UPI0037356F9F